MELRYADEVIVKRAILHVMDKLADEPVYSANELELNPATTLLITHHVIKTLGSDSNQKMKFKSNASKSYQAAADLCGLGKENGENFIEHSKEIANEFFNAIREYPTVRSADLIICELAIGFETVIGILKMDFQPSFVHEIKYEDDAFQITIESTESNLPSTSDKLTKSAIIKVPGEDDYDIVTLDYVVKNEDGSINEYFKNKVLDASIVLDHTDKTRIANGVFEKWIRNNMKDQIEKAILARKDIESLFINCGQLNIKAFIEDFIEDEAKRDKLEEHFTRLGVDPDQGFTIDKKYVAKAFKSYSIKTDTGVTIRMPFEAQHDNTKFEIEYNGDGTANMIVKNIRNLQRK